MLFLHVPYFVAALHTCTHMLHMYHVLRSIVYDLIFIAGIFSYAGEMDVVIKNLLLQQIKYKLQLVDGEVKKSKVRAITKLCVRHISATINRSASRNIFLEATNTKMVNLARHTQQNFSSSSSCDLTSSFSSSSPEDLLRQFELQIMNQDVVQI